MIPSDLVSEAATLRDLPVSAIEPNRFQPRERFDDEALGALSDSIRELGVLQPVLVRPLDDERFELVAGERRWRAARRAGLATIPALVRSVGDTTSLQQALVENLQRENLTVLEEAAAYQQLLEDFGLTQDQVASRVGRSRSAVANTIRLLQLPAAVQLMIAEGQLSAGHARALLASPDRALQERLARQAIAEALTVRQLEERLRQLLRVEEHREGAVAHPDRPTAASDGAPSQEPAIAERRLEVKAVAERAPTDDLPPAGLVELEQVLGDYFDTTVRVSSGRSRGRITIDFADLADLERIFRLIVHDT